MPQAAVPIMVASMVASAGTAVYQASEARDARKKASAAAKNQEVLANMKIKQADEEREKGIKKASSSGEQAKTAARKAGKARQRSTVLTSGLGIPGEMTGSRRTLLGG